MKRPTAKGSPRRARAAAPDREAETRARILEAGGYVFAQHGYRDGTVREICRRASANISAVAYHFGSKLELYEAVLRRAQEYATGRYPMTGVSANAADDPEGALRNFVHLLLRRLLDRGRPAWHGQLMMREMAQPTAAFHILSEELAGPIFREAAVIVSVLLGDTVDSDATRLAVASVVGQCTFYRNSRSLIAILGPGTTTDIELLTDHITRFSLAGLAASRKSRTRSGARSSTQRKNDP